MTNYNLLATAGIEPCDGPRIEEARAIKFRWRMGACVSSGNQILLKPTFWLRTKIVLRLNSVSRPRPLKLSRFDLRPPWEDIFAFDANFPVSGNPSSPSYIAHLNCQKIVKRPLLVGPCPTITVLSGDRVMIHRSLWSKTSLTLDTSGSPPFKCGYWVEKGAAPLREHGSCLGVMLTTWCIRPTTSHRPMLWFGKPLPLRQP